MLIKSPAKTKNFFNFVLPFVLLFQWTMPAMEKNRNIHINYSDITFEKCNDPGHSHPPLSQRDSTEELEKLVNSDLNNSFFVNGYKKYFDFSAKNIFEKPETLHESLLKHFPPSRDPPYLEV